MPFSPTTHQIALAKKLLEYPEGLRHVSVYPSGMASYRWTDGAPPPDRQAVSALLVNGYLSSPPFTSSADNAEVTVVLTDEGRAWAKQL